MTQERAEMTQDEINKSVLNPHFEAKIPSRPRWAGGDADDPMGDGLIWLINKQNAARSTSPPLTFCLALLLFAANRLLCFALICIACFA